MYSLRKLCFVQPVLCFNRNQSRLCNMGFQKLTRTKNVKFLNSLIPSKQMTYTVNHISMHIRGFHSSPRRDIHPAIWVLLKPILNISAALTGRSVRKWYQRLDTKEKRTFWSIMKANWPVWVGIGASLVGTFYYYYTSHIQETPITGRKRFVALTHNQVVLISETEAESILNQYKDKVCGKDDMETIRVVDIMMRLTQANPELQNMKFDGWHIFVIKDDLVNACVLPTGHVFVFDGMLKLTTSQDQLAVVLGHEMAHALLEHGVEELSYAQLVDYVIIAFMAALWCLIPSDGISFITQWFHNKVIRLLTHLPHSRTIELEADKVGTMLAARACYDVREGSVLWKKMDSVQKINQEDVLPEWMSTHPDNVKRAEYIDFLVPQAEKWKDDMQCPKWPNKDPRKAMEILSKKVDNYIVAQKAGQDLRRVQMISSPGVQTTGLLSKASYQPSVPSVSKDQAAVKSVPTSVNNGHGNKTNNS